MDEEKINYQLNWYLPNGEKTVKIPLVSIDNNLCNDMEANMSDGYLAQIIKDFYYAEAYSSIEDNDINNELKIKIDSLNDMHEDIVLLKRIFNDVLVSSKKITSRLDEIQPIENRVWEKIGYFFYDIIDNNYIFYNRPFRWPSRLFNSIYFNKIDNIKIENLLEEVKRCYEEEDVEEIINAEQVLFGEIRNNLFTKEDEEQFIQLWIETVLQICEIPNPGDFSIYNRSQAINRIDEFLGEMQKQICDCMLFYSQKAYDKIKEQNRHIRKFLWYLKCNKEVKEAYIVEADHMRCYSLMWSGEERIKYFALSGIDREQYYGKKIKELVPEYLHYEQVMLNSNVRFYFDNNEFIKYGDVVDADRKKFKKLVSCCERKLLTKVTDLNIQYHMFIKLEPCEKCKRAFCAYDPKSQIDIISPKCSYSESRKKIKEEDDLAHKISTK